MRTLCIAAQFYHMKRMPRKSRQMAERAMQMHPVDVEARMLIHTLGELGMDREAGECARLPLQHTRSLRVPGNGRALALLRCCGGGAEAAWPCSKRPTTANFCTCAP